MAEVDDPLFFWQKPSASPGLYAWEEPLVQRATQVGTEPPTADHHETDEDLLYWAHNYCARLTQYHSRTFYMASRFLPTEKRNAVRALYTFCRTTDDIVDNPHDNPLEVLERWRERALAWDRDSQDLVQLAWTDARLKYGIPIKYAEQLIDGAARDLQQSRYAAFAELADYCYGVASTVGLMSMHIIGFNSEAAIPYAIRLGVALQLTNILRDVAEDWRRDRLYLPLDELAAFGLGPEDIERSELTDAWREFLRFQIARNRRLYEEAWPGVAMLAVEGRPAIAAAADFYSGILDDIEAHDYDVFSRRAYVSGWGKARRVPGLFWRTRIRPLLSRGGGL